LGRLQTGPSIKNRVHLECPFYSKDTIGEPEGDLRAPVQFVELETLLFNGTT
jgi:hypothetical protein